MAKKKQNNPNEEAFLNDLRASGGEDEMEVVGLWPTLHPIIKESLINANSEASAIDIILDLNKRINDYLFSKKLEGILNDKEENN